MFLRLVLPSCWPEAELFAAKVIALSCLDIATNADAITTAAAAIDTIATIFCLDTWNYECHEIIKSLASRNKYTAEHNIHVQASRQKIIAVTFASIFAFS